MPAIEPARQRHSQRPDAEEAPDETGEQVGCIASILTYAMRCLVPRRLADAARRFGHSTVSWTDSPAPVRSRESIASRCRGDRDSCRFADRAPPTEADCEPREEYNEEEYRNLATRLCASDRERDGAILDICDFFSRAPHPLEMEAVRRMGVDLERHAAVTKERIFAAFPPKATAPERASTPAPAIAGRDCRSRRQAVRRGVEPSRKSPPERAAPTDRGAAHPADEQRAKRAAPLAHWERGRG